MSRQAVFESRAAFTPLPDGRVHQFIERSRDNGATWSTYFDGYYRRKVGASPSSQATR